MRKRGKLWLWAAAALVLLGAAAADYMGWHYFYRYQSERGRVRSIQAGFVRLEASLKQAARFSGQPVFWKERTRLYLEMAMAENEFGTPAERDAYLDEARESAGEWIRRSPVDARAFYEMGKIYLLYNFPLLTYADQGRAFLRRAVALKPADEFLNSNVLYIFMTQWNFLVQEEKDFVAAQWRLLTDNSTDFEDKIRRRWQENFKNTAAFDEILRQLRDGSY